MDVLKVGIHLFIKKCSSKGQVTVSALMVALLCSPGGDSPGGDSTG